MKRYLFLVFAAVLLAAAGVFAVRNTNPVRVDVVVATGEAPLAVWLVAAVVIGALLAVVFMLPAWWRGRAERRRLRRELHDARDECDRLRRAPLRDR